MPSLSTIYAGRTIYYGYKHAFEDLGHTFYTLTSDDNQEELFEKVNPDIFISSLSDYNLKFLDLKILNNARKKGTKAFMSTHAWKSPMSKIRINEPYSLSGQKAKVSKIKNHQLGDVFFNPMEQGDERMEGFQKETGYPHTTILLAADKTILYPEPQQKYRADISFIGTYLPEKRKFIEEYVFPLRKHYNLRLYGQDWTSLERLKGFAQKIGQYFNIPYLKSFQKAQLALKEERQVYSSSTICINIHEEYQRRIGGDCNERTFKIPLCDGFEITDDVACIHKYFKEGKEIIIAKDATDWFEKIAYFFKNPEKRLPIIRAGKKRVLQDHTYHNRIEQMIAIYNKIA